MNLLAKIRQRQTPWARRALGLFAVVWLNMALQPCAMALGGESSDNCPHCPPAMSGPNHSGHLAADDMASGAMPCVEDGSDCDFFDQYIYDGRTAQSKVKDAPSDVLLALVPAPVLVPRVLHDGLALPILHISSCPGVPPALNVLYCVYLD